MTSEVITLLLDAARRGDIKATDALFSVVYAGLQKTGAISPAALTR